MFSLGAGCWIEGRGSCEEQQGVEEAELELEDEFEPCWRH